jgi:predicted ATPase
MWLGNKFHHLLNIHNGIFDVDVYDIVKGNRKELYNYISCADSSYDYHLSDSPVVFMMLLLQSICNTIDNISYIGPFRNKPKNYYNINDIKINNYSYDDTYNKIYQRIVSDKSLLRQVNKYLSVLNIRYSAKVLHDMHEGSETVSLVLNRDNSQNVSRIEDVGFGISQILPIVVQCVACDEQPIFIEQPELHLHPALQAELGDLFIDSSMKNKNTLLIETHSEHILLRIMRRIRETTNGTLPEGVTPIRTEDVSVVYVESVETDGDRHSIIREMPLNDQGELVKAWPGGFFEEGLREVF